MDDAFDHLWMRLGPLSVQHMNNMGTIVAQIVFSGHGISLHKQRSQAAGRVCGSILLGASQLAGYAPTQCAQAEYCHLLPEQMLPYRN